MSQKSYNNAYIQHDSIMMLMDLEDDRYIQTNKMYNNLKDVVYNQTLIYTQDSLLSLALLPAEERNEIIDQYIESLKQQDLEEKNNSI